MPGTPTTRLSIPTLSGSDNVSTYPAVNLAQMNILDGAILYSEGTFASRPAAAVKGRVYKGTDTGYYYFDTGTAWLTFMLAGPWTNLTLTTGLVAGTVRPAYRVEGDLVRLRGEIKNPTGSAIPGPYVSGAPLPSVAYYPVAWVPTAGAFPLKISAAGIGDAAQVLNAGASQFIDGVAYPLG